MSQNEHSITREHIFCSNPYICQVITRQVNIMTVTEINVQPYKATDKVAQGIEYK